MEISVAKSQECRFNTGFLKKKAIKSIGRQGIRRVFSSNVLERLELIALGRAAGFSLKKFLGY